MEGGLRRRAGGRRMRRRGRGWLHAGAEVEEEVEKEVGAEVGAGAYWLACREGRVWVGVGVGTRVSNSRGIDRVQAPGSILPPTSTDAVSVRGGRGRYALSIRAMAAVQLPAPQPQPQPGRRYCASVLQGQRPRCTCLRQHNHNQAGKRQAVLQIRSDPAGGSPSGAGLCRSGWQGSSAPCPVGP